MGLDTRIYCDHELQIPNNTPEIVAMLNEVWNGKAVICNSMEVKEQDLVLDYELCKILISPKSIEYEYPKYKQLRLNTNFMFSSYIRIYPKTIQFEPIWIGRNATNMLAEFMEQPFSIYADDPVGFAEQKKNWGLFKSFLNNITSVIGSKKHLYINDGVFQGVEEVAWSGASVDEMVTEASKITAPCESKDQFIVKHTNNLNGMTYVNGDIWFCHTKA